MRGNCRKFPLKERLCRDVGGSTNSPDQRPIFGTVSKEGFRGKEEFPLSNFSFTTVARGSSERSERSRGTAESSPLRSGYAATSEVLLSSPTKLFSFYIKKKGAVFHALPYYTYTCAKRLMPSPQLVCGGGGGDPAFWRMATVDQFQSTPPRGGRPPYRP